MSREQCDWKPGALATIEGPTMVIEVVESGCDPLDDHPLDRPEESMDDL